MTIHDRSDALARPAPTDANASRNEARPEPQIDFSPVTYNQALRDVAVEELAIVRARYLQHRDPVRCAVGISLVLRSFAKDVFGEERVSRLRRIAWLNFLLRTSNERVLRPDVIETMSAALYGDPVGVDLPGDCTFWFEAAERWIEHQRERKPITTCETSVGQHL
ncbi:MAG: DUF4381 domain-containing protein [bacterium]|nr:DUF4381 domain-containing protein [bacterium]